MALFEKFLEDPAAKQNIIFLILGIMLGHFLSIVVNYCKDSPIKDPKVTKTEDESGSDWEDEESEDENASNANEE